MTGVIIRNEMQKKDCSHSVFITDVVKKKEMTDTDVIHKKDVIEQSMSSRSVNERSVIDKNNMREKLSRRC